MRVEVTNQIRGILKTFGIILTRRTGAPFERLVKEACDDDASMLGRTVHSLLAVYTGLKSQIQRLDRELMAYARRSAVSRQLMSIPGVGMLTALAFVTAIDDPTKFSKSRSVGAYLGLTPRCYQSGEIDQNRGISKCGDGLVRTYLFEAAGTLLTRVEKVVDSQSVGTSARQTQRPKESEDCRRSQAGCAHAPYVGGWRILPMVDGRTGAVRNVVGIIGIISEKLIIAYYAASSIG
jgi:transposase